MPFPAIWGKDFSILKLHETSCINKTKSVRRYKIYEIRIFNVNCVKQVIKAIKKLTKRFKRLFGKCMFRISTYTIVQKSLFFLTTPLKDKKIELLLQFSAKQNVLATRFILINRVLYWCTLYSVFMSKFKCLDACFSLVFRLSLFSRVHQSKNHRLLVIWYN